MSYGLSPCRMTMLTLSFEIALGQNVNEIFTSAASKLKNNSKITRNSGIMSSILVK